MLLIYQTKILLANKRGCESSNDHPYNQII